MPVQKFHPVVLEDPVRIKWCAISYNWVGHIRTPI